MNNPYLFSRLFLLSTTCLLLHACKKPDTTVNNEYVVQDVYINGKKTYSYNYNDKWQMTKSSYTYSINSRTTNTDKYDYFYNSDDRLERTDIIYISTLPSHRLEYTYNRQYEWCKIYIDTKTVKYPHYHSWAKRHLSVINCLCKGFLYFAVC